MTANEWRERAAAAAEAVELSLPSGMVIRARRPGPMQFAAWDKLPAMIAGGGIVGALGVSISDSEAVELAGFMRDLVVYCCLEPRVSVTPTAEEIHPRELPEADWTYIVRWAMRLEETEALRSFRSQRTDGRGDRDGAAVFVETVGAAGDRGPGSGAAGGPGGGTTGTGSGERG